MKKLFTIFKNGMTGMAPFAVVLVLSNLASAQGPIFTGDASNLSNIIRESLKLMAIVLFCLGAVGVAWSIYNKGLNALTSAQLRHVQGLVQGHFAK